ncbi:hypothetical protein HanIR_Chr01g0022721 [Helianthus annuus]|nr:hypothetical protein HanIR_Chr01g0022721 [Helianthus annuus]
MMVNGFFRLPAKIVDGFLRLVVVWLRRREREGEHIKSEKRVGRAVVAWWWGRQEVIMRADSLVERIKPIRVPLYIA